MTQATTRETNVAMLPQAIEAFLTQEVVIARAMIKIILLNGRGSEAFLGDLLGAGKLCAKVYQSLWDLESHTQTSINIHSIA